jgi:WD40 repeat protein
MGRGILINRGAFDIEPNQVAFSPSSNELLVRFAARYEQGEYGIKVWDVLTADDEGTRLVFAEKPKREMPIPPQEVGRNATFITWSPDGKWIIGAGHDGDIWIYDPSDGQPHVLLSAFHDTFGTEYHIER